jgi:hypothetical protein
MLCCAGLWRVRSWRPAADLVPEFLCGLAGMQGMVTDIAMRSNGGESHHSSSSSSSSSSTSTSSVGTASSSRSRSRSSNATKAAEWCVLHVLGPLAHPHTSTTVKVCILLLLMMSQHAVAAVFVMQMCWSWTWPATFTCWTSRPTRASSPPGT